VPLDFVPPFLWLVGVIQGHRALHAIRAGAAEGRGAALVGLVAGYLGLGVVALILLALGALLVTGIGLAGFSRFIPYLPKGRL
jgi:hypothetical protein